MAWLQDALSQSSAKFKVLLSGSSWTDRSITKKNTWTAYSEDRNGLFHYIRAKIKSKALCYCPATMMKLKSKRF
jgi:hypothetical protein